MNKTGKGGFGADVVSLASDALALADNTKNAVRRFTRKFDPQAAMIMDSVSVVRCACYELREYLDLPVHASITIVVDQLTDDEAKIIGKSLGALVNGHAEAIVFRERHWTRQKPREDRMIVRKAVAQC